MGAWEGITMVAMDFQSGKTSDDSGSKSTRGCTRNSLLPLHFPLQAIFVWRGISAPQAVDRTPLADPFRSLRRVCPPASLHPTVTQLWLVYQVRQEQALLEKQLSPKAIAAGFGREK
jgi:hypothetical protein